MMESVITILTLVLTSSGGGILIKHFLDKRKTQSIQRKRDALVDGLRAFANVFASMKRLQESAEVDRVLLVEISNGGNAPKVGNKLYARAVSARHDDKSVADQMMEKYEQVLIDQAYIQMCVDVASNPAAPHVVDMASYPPCLLKNYYLNDKVTYSEVYHIYTDHVDQKMFIMSVATTGKEEQFKADVTRAFISSEVTAIRTQFERYRN